MLVYNWVRKMSIREIRIRDIGWFTKFGKLGFGIIVFGILDISGKCPVWEIGFGKRYIQEIGIWKIVWQGYHPCKLMLLVWLRVLVWVLWLYLMAIWPWHENLSQDSVDFVGFCTIVQSCGSTCVLAKF